MSKEYFEWTRVDKIKPSSLRTIPFYKGLISRYNQTGIITKRRRNPTIESIIVRFNSDKSSERIPIEMKFMLCPIPSMKWYIAIIEAIFALENQLNIVTYNMKVKTVLGAKKRITNLYLPIRGLRSP